MDAEKQMKEKITEVLKKNRLDLHFNDEDFDDGDGVWDEVSHIKDQLYDELSEVVKGKNTISKLFKLVGKELKFPGVLYSEKEYKKYINDEYAEPDLFIKYHIYKIELEVDCEDEESYFKITVCSNE